MTIVPIGIKFRSELAGANSDLFVLVSWMIHQVVLYNVTVIGVATFVSDLIKEIQAIKIGIIRSTSNGYAYRLRNIPIWHSPQRKGEKLFLGRLGVSHS